jgi:hypothetical protein
MEVKSKAFIASEKMEKKRRRKPEAVQRRDYMEEKMPAASQISDAGVLSVDEIFPPRPLLMKPLCPWARAFAETTGTCIPMN